MVCRRCNKTGTCECCAYATVAYLESWGDVLIRQLLSPLSSTSKSSSSSGYFLWHGDHSCCLSALLPGNYHSLVLETLFAYTTYMYYFFHCIVPVHGHSLGISLLDDLAHEDLDLAN